MKTQNYQVTTADGMNLNFNLNPDSPNTQTILSRLQKMNAAQKLNELSQALGISAENEETQPK